MLKGKKLYKRPETKTATKIQEKNLEKKLKQNLGEISKKNLGQKF